MFNEHQSNFDYPWIIDHLALENIQHEVLISDVWHTLCAFNKTNQSDKHWCHIDSIFSSYDPLLFIIKTHFLISVISKFKIQILTHFITSTLIKCVFLYPSFNRASNFNLKKSVKVNFPRRHHIFLFNQTLRTLRSIYLYSVCIHLFTTLP